MRILSGKAAERAVAQIERRGSRLDEVEPAARRIVQAVRKGGDKALARYATLWDSLPKGQSLRVPPEEIEQGWKSTPQETREALKKAAANIRRFANWQMPRSWSRKSSGGELGQIVRPLGSVGCYVPGGRYPLPSTLLMTAIPAQVAGVVRVVVMTPKPQAVTLAAGYLLGINEVYRCGGAQAIAALAYGTETIGRVDKIVGPGNAYVTAAKKLVGFDCSIDMLAGPTEAVIYSESGNAEFLASDLVAQAEHDPDAVVVFISTSTALAKAVVASMQRVVAGKRGCDAGDPAQCVCTGGGIARAGDGVGKSHRARAPDRGRRLGPAGGVQRRVGFCGRLLTATCRGLCGGAESCAADCGSRALSRRIERGGLREGHHGAEIPSWGAARNRSGSDEAS